MANLIVHILNFSHNLSSRNVRPITFHNPLLYDRVFRWKYVHMNSTITLTTSTAPKYTIPRHNAIYYYRTDNITLSPRQNTPPRKVTAKLTRSEQRICFDPVYHRHIYYIDYNWRQCNATGVTQHSCLVRLSYLSLNYYCCCLPIYNVIKDIKYSVYCTQCTGE